MTGRKKRIIPGGGYGACRLPLGGDRWAPGGGGPGRWQEGDPGGGVRRGTREEVEEDPGGRREIREGGGGPGRRRVPRGEGRVPREGEVGFPGGGGGGGGCARQLRVRANLLVTSQRRLLLEGKVEKQKRQL